MRFIQKRCFLALIGTIFVFIASAAFAFDDGFRCNKKIEGQNITVCLSSGLDAASLTEQLDVRPSDKIITGQSPESKDSAEAELVQMLDTLFMRVSDVLDMHLYSLKTNVKICKTDTDLNSFYDHLFQANLGGRRSFYVYDFNSVYVSAESLRSGIIAHELAHAIIGHFFAIPAPVKVQEVLAMYVEYNLNN